MIESETDMVYIILVYSILFFFRFVAVMNVILKLNCQDANQTRYSNVKNLIKMSHRKLD